MELVPHKRDASRRKSLAAAFELAERAMAAGLEGDNYISPTRDGGGWIVDVRGGEDGGDVLGYVRDVEPRA